MINSGSFIKHSGVAIAPEIKVSSQSALSFLVHAGIDPGKAEDSVQLYIALKCEGDSAELHIDASGGNGFGLRRSEKAANSWPNRYEPCHRDSGVLLTEPEIPDHFDPSYGPI